MEVLDEPGRYTPEQVFYIRNLRTDDRGMTALMMVRPEGDAFHISFDRKTFPHTVRWVLVNDDQKVCAFALPSTCEPEGYLAESKKGHVLALQPGTEAEFSVRLGYLDAAGAKSAEDHIRSL
jgi:hypothetical protein